MKTSFSKTSVLLFILISTVFWAQKSAKLPADAVFYMEINGKQLNKKINWDKFNPILKEINKKEDKKNTWNDYSKTGIRYDATQYHYGTINDSVQSYTTLFTLENKDKFQEFINSVKKHGLEVSKKNNYSYVDIENDIFVAWNDKKAVLKFINYNKKEKNLWEDNAEVDSAVAAVDTVAIDSAYAEVEKPFDYKEEIGYLKNDIKYLKESIKENNAEIAKIQKDIKYLQKHHKYPEEKKEDSETTDSNYQHDSAEVSPPLSQDDYYGSDQYELDSVYQKQQDSISIVRFKMLKKFAENDFDEYFSSNLELDVDKNKLSFRDANSDAFIYADYDKIISKGLYDKLYKGFNFMSALGKLYSSDSAYNLYFDDEKVRLVNNHRNKNPELQKSISQVYKGKKNKKLAALINDKSVGYYTMNINGYKYFDMMYDMMQNAGDEKYQKEIQLVMETIKIVLDEEAIAKIAPGNGIFVLNELKTKNVEYTDYTYDDDYNEKEVKKNKDIVVPDFTFAFATENEKYWNRVFDVITNNKEIAKKFTKDGDFYVFRDEKNKNGYIDQLFFTVKDGIVYLTTSKNTLEQQNQSEMSKKWMKDSSKYPLSGRLDIQKLMLGLDKEFKKKSERKMLDAVRKNVGEMYFKTEVKDNSIQTEMNYNIKNSSENSLMYFFDLFDELYKISEEDQPSQTL